MMRRKATALLLVAALVLSLTPLAAAGGGGKTDWGHAAPGVGALAADSAPADAYESTGDGLGGGVVPTWSTTRDLAPLLPRWTTTIPGWGIEPYTEQHTIDTATLTDWDEDWFKLTVSATDFNDWAQLSYRFDAYSADPDIDLVLDVYANPPVYAAANTLSGADSANALTSNDDTPWGTALSPLESMRWSSVTFVPPAAGTYWIRVRPYWGNPATGFTGCAGAYSFRAKVGQVDRLYGADRVATAVRISQEGWSTKPEESQDSTVVLAYGQNYPDALAAGSLAGASRGPILLTPSGYLPTSVADEIKRLGARGVYIVGGESVISEDVVDDLEAFLPSERIVRVAGANRYETAVEVLKKTDQLLAFQGGTMPRAAFVVSGANFPDALAVAPMSYWNTMPVLLTPPTYLHSATASVIAMYGIDDVIVAGGTSAVSDAAVGGLIDDGMPPNRVLRVAGTNRYETAKEIAAWACDLKGPGPRGDFLVGTLDNAAALYALPNASFNSYASGASYPDALAGGPFAGKIGAPVLLTPVYLGTPFLFGADGEIPPGSSQWFADLANNSRLPIQRSYLLGGPSAVTGEVYREIDVRTGWEP